MARGGGGRSDDEDEERGGAGGKQLARSSRDEQAKDEVGGGAGSRAHDAERRTARWLSFAKPKLILGFEHLSPAYVPSMGSRKNGVSVCFDKITCWRPPRQLLADLDAGGFEVSVQLSLSLFHLSSGTFFGSTWMGESHLLGGDGRDKLPELIDFDYPEVVYFVSRITDPSCVAVVEIVASKEGVKAPPKPSTATRSPPRHHYHHWKAWTVRDLVLDAGPARGRAACPAGVARGSRPAPPGHPGDPRGTHRAAQWSRQARSVGGSLE